MIHRFLRAGAGLSAFATLALLLPVPAGAEPTWRPLQPGVDYALLADRQDAAVSADHEGIHVVRIDPGRAPLVAAMASAGDRQARTAAAWCRSRGLAVAINLGMYRTDHLTNVGHAHAPGHANNAGWASRYKSALAFAPLKKGLPAAVMIDLDAPGGKDRVSEYGAVVQNLRLIRAPGQNVWGKQDRRWSEAAVATDKQGRVLFVFSRHPYSMHEFNAKLLALPLDITNAMHVEGGPEASLSIHAGGVNLDLNGSYESGFNENDGEHRQWPIPNVLGVPRDGAGVPGDGRAP
jgi:hypothetical protein